MSTLSVPKFTYRPQQQRDVDNFANPSTTSGSRPTSPHDSNNNNNSLLMKSTLAGVFGSQASLSDLAGDTDPYHYTYKAHTPPRSVPRRRRTIDNDEEFLNDINRSLITPRIIVATAVHDTPTSSQASPAPEMTASAATSSGLTPVTNPGHHRRRRHQQLVHAWAQLQLFGFGVVYGELANRFFAQSCYPRTSAATSPQQQQPQMLVWWAWGIVCLIVGTLMPYLDRTRPAWLEQGFFLPSKTFFYSSFAHTSSSNINSSSSSSNGLGSKKSIISQCDWNSAIRTFAAFLGLGLGVRKLPVSSLAQVAWLWALVSPVLWFLLDGTWTGLVAGLVAAAAGGVLTSIKTSSPATTDAADGNGVELPIALCLYFCCALCFGNIGRRLMK